MKPDPYEILDNQADNGQGHGSGVAGRLWRAGLLTFSALLLGGTVALAWLIYPQLNQLGTVPQEEASREPSPTPSALAAQPDSKPEVATSSALAQAPALPRSTSSVLVTATPTPVASREVVVGSAGATLWDEETGLLLATLPRGELLTATARSTDDQWLLVHTAAGVSGWVRTAELIVVETRGLRAEPVAIVPMVPTATPAPAMANATQSAEADGAPADASTLSTPTQRPSPEADGRPTARVIIEDARLNVRAGPGTTYPVIAKALPEEHFVVLGRNEAGDWIQIALPDVDGGIGWVATEYVELSEPVTDLPVRSETSSAPRYQEGTPGDSDLSWQPKARPKTQMTGGAGLSGTLAIQVRYGQEIYLYDLASGELRYLTWGFDPAISPDGRQVAFTRDGGDHGLYLIHVDGSNERRIFSGRELLRAPKWSPDGRWILFQRGDQYVLCRDLASQCRRTPLLEDGVVPEKERQPQLARVDVNGENYQDLATLLYAQAADWNQAGIVYQSGAGIQITRDEPSATTVEVYYEPFKQYEMDPDWQPNGGRIAFQRKEASHWEIFAINPDGSGLVALTRPRYTLVEQIPSNVAPAWSPDGSHLVFLSNRDPDNPDEAGAWGVWVMDADGANPQRLPIELPFEYTYVSEQMLDWGP